MKLWSVFRVSLREQLRSPWDLLLVLIFAPAFIIAYWSFMGGGSTYYPVLVMNQDRGQCPVGDGAVSCAEQAIAAMKLVTYESGDALLRITLVADRSIAEQKLRDRDAAALVIFPPDFSQSIQAALHGQPSGGKPVTFVGDLNNPYYSVAGIAANAAIDGYIQVATQQTRPVAYAEEPLGGSGTRSEFETYVPGLLLTSATLMMFSIAIAVTHQLEAGVHKRLQITRMRALDYMGGISLLYILIAVVSVLLSFWTAQLLGFHSQGPLWVAIIICAITSFAVIGVGLITASFSGTSARAAIVVNFPLVLLLFFSGSVFPPVKVTLFTIGGHAIRIFDFLPHTHAVVALNKVLSLGAGLDEVIFELVAMTLLSVLYFMAGVWLFKRRHLS
jgi:ABC-type multidrug transport system permease subunit